MWSPWGAWSECSESCGGGLRQHTRTCISFVENLLLDCPGNSQESEICNNVVSF